MRKNDFFSMLIFDFKKYIFIFVFPVFCFLLAFGANSAVYDLTDENEFDLGVYYFPGWKDNTVGLESANPWDKIKKFPDREPYLGWYSEDDIDVMNQQLEWMHQYGVNYVVFDWLWGRDSKGYLEHALKLYLKSENKSKVGFSILWANHTEYKFSKRQLTNLIDYWCGNFFIYDEFKKVNGKPLVYVFSGKTLFKNIIDIGMSPSEFLQYADQLAINHGFQGITFVFGVGANDSEMKYSGFSSSVAFSAYNFHSPATKKINSISNMSHSYKELDESYQDQWHWMLKNSDGFFIVPITSGWDKSPWGGSSDPLHDKSVSTPEEFEGHLLAAKSVLRNNSDKTHKMAVICCWNEYGEGSYIEPTKKHGFSYLQKIKNVFQADK